MEQHTWAFIFGILGNAISLAVFLSPIPTFVRVYRSKSTEGFQSTPYVVTLFSCTLWILYALVKPGSELLLTINGVGCAIEAAYLAMYLVYATKASRVLTAKMLLGLNVGLLGAVALLAVLLPARGTLRAHVLGWVCVSVAIAVFAAPLSIIRQVIRTKSVEFMPFHLSLCLVVSAVVWFAYGALKMDVFVAVPNVLGFLFGVAQVALYMAYRKNTTAPKAAELVVMAEEAVAAGTKLPEHAVEPQHHHEAGSRASCGAEVHPIGDDDLEDAVVIDVEPPPPTTTCAAADMNQAGIIRPDTVIAVAV